jgi:integrase
VPKINFSDVTLRNLRAPEKGQQTYWDATGSATGFGLRVSCGGSKTFIVMAGPPEKRRRYVLGRYPAMSLSDARKQARKVQSELLLGQRSTSSVLFKDALRIFLETHCLGHSKTHRVEVARLLNKHFLPALGNKYLDQIKTSDLTRIFDPLTQSTPVLANNAYARIKTFLNWSVRRGYIPHSPCEPLLRPAAITTRDRVLTRDELRTVYKAAAKLGNPYGFISLMCIHLLARRGEIAQV